MNPINRAAPVRMQCLAARVAGIFNLFVERDCIVETNSEFPPVLHQRMTLSFSHKFRFACVKKQVRYQARITSEFGHGAVRRARAGRNFAIIPKMSRNQTDRSVWPSSSE